MGIISFIIVLAITSFGLWKLADRFSLSPKVVLIGWSVKLFFAFAFLLVFSLYYGQGVLYGDAYNFMNDSRILSEFGRSNPLEYIKLLFGIGDEQALFEGSVLSQTQIWSYGENGDFINDNRLIIRLNSLIHFISFGFTYTHVLCMAFLSYTGILLLFKAFKKFMANPLLFFWVILVFPSIAFWGSGITKENLMLFSLGVFFFGFTGFFDQKKGIYLLLVLTGSAMLLFNKPHVGLIVLPLSLLLVGGNLFQWIKPLRYLFPIFVLGATIVLTYTPTEVNLLDKVSYKQRDLINMGKGGIFFVTDSAFCAFDYEYLLNFSQQPNQQIQVLRNTTGTYKLFGQPDFYPFEISPSNQFYDIYLIQPPSESYVDVTPINYQRSRLLTNLPEVLNNTIIRPYPWDSGSTLRYGAFASNLLFFGCLIFTLLNQRKIDEREKYWLTYFMVTAIMILLLIGWTTPILGAIVRYKIAAELLILIGLCMLLKPLNYAKS